MRGREYTLLLASQPTRGVDVGAIEFIHAQLRAARDAGKAVLLVSADLVEVLALADRVAVMYEGRIVAMLDGERGDAGAGRRADGRRRDGRRGTGDGSGAFGAGGDRRMSLVNPRIPDSTPRPPSLASRLLAALLPPVTALLIAAVVGDLLILSFGQSPAEVFTLLLEGTWGNAYGFGQVVYKATTLIFTGLSVAIGIRAGLFNIGAEGQLAMGGFCAALVGLWLPAGTPALIAIPLCLAAAALGGALVASVPGVLKARFGASEVIVTIMVNFITLAFLNWIVSAKLHVAESLHTPEIATRSGVGACRSSWARSVARRRTSILLVALAAAAYAAWYLFRTRAGFDLRAVGLQPEAAEYGGVQGRRRLAAGDAPRRRPRRDSAGPTTSSATSSTTRKDSPRAPASSGSRWRSSGATIRSGVVIAAFLFATLSQGGLAVNAVVPKQMVDVLTAVVIIAVATSVPEVQRLLKGLASGVATGARRGVER